MNELALQQPIDSGLRELALFAGAGGGILGGKILGWRTVCAVELDAYARSILLARQDDGTLDPFPVWDDVTTFDGRPWRGRVDVVSGGFPCQDISAAGKGAGITGERSGLWREMVRIIGEVLPRFVLVENSPMLVGRGLGLVLGDLAALGYDAQWGVVGARHAGAPHKRDRIWIKANARCREQSQQCDTIKVHSGGAGAARSAGAASRSGGNGGAAIVADAESTRLEGHGADAVEPQESESRDDGSLADADEIGRLRRAGEIAEPDGRGQSADGGGELGTWWQSEPNMDGVVDGMAAPMDIHGAAAAGDVGRVATRIPNRNSRLRCIGNGQVPACAAMAWRILTDALK